VEEVTESLGVNSRADLGRAIGVIRQRIIDVHLHNGVTIEDPRTTFIDHGVSIGADTIIRPCTVIETGVSIGKRCSIGPFARLRSGVAIADDVRVGNFVELVRTKVGQRVRVNHVTYLGDATLEEDVNIGAGTITANYDGKDKHQTQIGRGAFIGSDTILIAPVKVGASAVTGAGSVVPKGHDVPPKGVVVGVPARALDGRLVDGRAEPTGQRPAAARVAKSVQKPTRVVPKAKTAKKAKRAKKTTAKRVSRSRPRPKPRPRRRPPSSRKQVRRPRPRARRLRRRILQRARR